MNDVKSFTFYNNFFDLLDNVKREDKLILLEAIVDYVFKDKEPHLEGLNNAIWNAIKVSLDTSKSRSESGKNKTKAKKKQNKSKKETKKVTNNISLFSFLISNFNYLDRGLLRGKIEEWLKYKDERRETYTEVGLKSLLTRIQNNCEKYSDEQIADLIDECMSNNWKGIIWEKLKGKEKSRDEKILEKFNTAEIKIDNENQKELEELIKSYE